MIKVKERILIWECWCKYWNTIDKENPSDVKPCKKCGSLITSRELRKIGLK
mgnify:CR=1 FL=1